MTFEKTLCEDPDACSKQGEELAQRPLRQEGVQQEEQEGGVADPRWGGGPGEVGEEEGMGA